MSDEDVPQQILNQEEVQEIIDWAVGAAAMIVLMKNAPEHDDMDEAIERLDGYIQAIDLMVDNMPDTLVEPAYVVASEAIEDAEQEEEMVQQFLEEMDEHL